MSSFQNIICPACAAQLCADERSMRGVMLCTNCAVQFRLGGPWPVIRTSGKAIASFVLGIGAIGGLCFTGIPAFILGLWALNEMQQRRNAEILTGRRLAIVGATLGGLLSLATFAIPLIIFTSLATYDEQQREAMQMHEVVPGDNQHDR